MFVHSTVCIHHCSLFMREQNMRRKQLLDTAVSSFFLIDLLPPWSTSLLNWCNHLSQIYSVADMRKIMYPKHFVWKLQFYSHHLTRFDPWFPWIKYPAHGRCSINTLVYTIFYTPFKKCAILCSWENLLRLLFFSLWAHTAALLFGPQERESIHFSRFPLLE